MPDDDSGKCAKESPRGHLINNFKFSKEPARSSAAQCHLGLHPEHESFQGHLRGKRLAACSDEATGKLSQDDASALGNLLLEHAKSGACPASSCEAGRAHPREPFGLRLEDFKREPLAAELLLPPAAGAASANNAAAAVEAAQLKH